VWLFKSKRISVRELPIASFVRRLLEGVSPEDSNKNSGGRIFSRAILDVDIVKNVLRNYLLTLGFLIAMYVLFTAFELWKFAGTIDNGVSLLGQYLFYLLPFIYTEIAASALMVATVSTFVIKTRQNEVVTWTAAGRSIYRLLAPCFVLAICIGGFNFFVQETILPTANREQDRLREQIRSRNEILAKKDSYQNATKNRILTFDQLGASDNDKEIQNLKIYSFNKDGRLLASVSEAGRAKWTGTMVSPIGSAVLTEWDGLGRFKSTKVDAPIKIDEDPFQQVVTKPSHLSISETRKRISTSISDAARRSYSVSYYKKYGTLLISFIIVLFTAPFALSIHRTGNVITIAYAAGLWLLFMGAITVFSQLGSSGMLPASMAVGAPLLIFSLIGMSMLSRIRT